MLIKTSHRRLKQYLKNMLIYTMVILVVTIQYLRYILHKDIEKQMAFRLGRLHNYDETINIDRTYMNNYYQK